ncbi:MAG: Gfo/Idh/MocA family oxidoreductase [Candidatus Caldarchaeum sp.]|nr:Gfo/Idh/MocA family oxidoreductase [Candidatus Caldarchaeum sp.]MCS7134204.1 Gfo/Idh/MocA family oxidoreductase [Candidatus Caldarchaeum sp.]MDW8435072.1 Gfo/Idh/MocA family oxidoreductase [Candidatus Caldarchaeum sp.]
MTKIARFCLIGAGRAGAVHARNLRRRIKTGELAAIVDANLEAASKLGEEVGIKNLYSDLSTALRSVEFDAVIITTPTFTHAALTMQAAEAGKHVFCEKPMALNLEEADRMITGCRKAGVKLQIGFMRRFDPEFVSAKQHILNGEIGKPVLVKSVGRGPGLPPPWALDRKTGIGFLAEVNSHDFDSLRWLMGDEYSSIYSETAALIRPDLVSTYPGFYDVAAVVAKFRGGGLGFIDGACPVGYGYDARVEVLGTEGVIVVGEIRGTTLHRINRENRVISETFRSWRDRFREGYIGEIEHFIDCIVNDREPAVTGIDGRKALEAVLAAHRSMETGKPVFLPLG